MAIIKSDQLRRAYGFDEVAIVPGDVTANPDQTNIDFHINNFNFSIPIIAAAMDAVTDASFAILMGKLGGLAVLNLEGVQSRYDTPQEILSEITKASDDSVIRREGDLRDKEHLFAVASLHSVPASGSPVRATYSSG